MVTHPKIYGIAGPSGSGKTTYEKQWSAELGGAPVLELDAYYRPAEPGEIIEDRNFDHPDALDVELFVAHLKQWKSGQNIVAPIYDFSVHAWTGETLTIPAGPILFVEGLLLLHFALLRALLDHSIYLDTDFDACYRRRLFRDVSERGRTEANVHEQFRKNVRPMYESYVLPSRKWADEVK